jgi:hypothetical protein
LVSPDANFEVNDFQLEKDKTATVTVQYSLSKLPKVRLSSAKEYDNQLKELKLEHLDPGSSFRGEASLLENNKKSYERFEYKLLCGRNLGCEKWKLSFVSGDSIFGGDRPTLQAKCIDSGDDGTCVVLSVYKAPGIFWTVIMFTYVGIAVAIVMGDAVYCVLSPRTGYDEDHDSRFEGKSLDGH